MPTTDQHTIRKAIQFLTKTNKSILKTAALLLKLHGVQNPPGESSLLKEYSFTVEGHAFKGTMTKEQHEALKSKTGSILKFGHALDKIHLNANNKTLRALGDLESALGVSKPKKATPAAPAPAASGPAYSSSALLAAAPLGCCVYDTTQEGGITQAYCIGPLQGTWTPGPCSSANVPTG